MFCIVGKIQPSESLFVYESGKSAADYSGDGFTPSFGIIFPDSDSQTKAEALCTFDGKLDKTCMYDFLYTGNAELATNTKNTQAVNTATAKDLGKISS